MKAAAAAATARGGSGSGLDPKATRSLLIILHGKRAEDDLVRGAISNLKAEGHQVRCLYLFVLLHVCIGLVVNCTATGPKAIRLLQILAACRGRPGARRHQQPQGRGAPGALFVSVVAATYVHLAAISSLKLT
jgi:hypothetical protein